MDQVFITALVRQALSAYALHGEAGLEQWKAALPAPHREEFEKYCSDPLDKAIAALAPVMGEVKRDPRKTHRVDRRRTKPL